MVTGFIHIFMLFYTSYTFSTHPFLSANQLSLHPSTQLSIHPLIHLPTFHIHIHTHSSIHPPSYPSFTYLLVDLSNHPPMYLSIYTISICIPKPFPSSQQKRCPLWTKADHPCRSSLTTTAPLSLSNSEDVSHTNFFCRPFSLP